MWGYKCHKALGSVIWPIIGFLRFIMDFSWGYAHQPEKEEIVNQLSWLLYIGNVAGNLGPFFVIGGLILVAMAIVMWIVNFAMIEAHLEKIRDNYKYSHFRSQNEDEEAVTEINKRIKAAPRFWVQYILLPVGLLFWVCAALCPSSDTVYAIAASQVGEQALKTPLANKAEQAIESWLNAQIAKNTTPKS